MKGRDLLQHGQKSRNDKQSPTMKSKPEIGNTLKTVRISPRAQDVPPAMTPTIA